MRNVYIISVSEEIPPRTEFTSDKQPETDKITSVDKEKLSAGKKENILKKRQVKSVDENDNSTDSESSKSNDKLKGSTKV